MKKTINNLLSFIPKFYLEKLKSCFFKNYKEKLKREKTIQNLQNNYIKLEYDNKCKKLIIFLLPTADFEGNEKKTGGMISIESIYNVTKSIIKDSEVIFVTENDANLYFRFNFIKSDYHIFRFDQIRNFFISLEEVILHIPEYLTSKILKEINSKPYSFKNNLKKFHINILNQNIEYMPSIDIIDKLKLKCDSLTQTTAHKKYANEFIRNKYNIPLHHFSTKLDARDYYFKPLDQKEELILFSNDNEQLNTKIKNKILQFTTKYKFITINNISYEEYKILISRAKYCFSFGEGLDGYFIETFLSGGITFTIFNSSFFTNEYKDLFSVVNNFEILEEEIINMFLKLEDEEHYDNYNSFVRSIINKQYNFDEYCQNIENFYRADYLFK